MLMQLRLLIALPALAAASASHSKLQLRSVASRYASRYGLRGRSGRVAGRSRVPEQLEKWQDSSKAIRSSLSGTELLELAAPVTMDVYGRQLHELVDTVKSRYVVDPGNSHTAEYVKKQFEAMGLSVSQQKVDDYRIKDQFANLNLLEKYSNSKRLNVVGFRKGTDLAHEVVILGAHFDSVNWENTAGPAPGVDDNGSGIALMLSVAKILASANFRPRRSLMFVAFNAEEEGLVGSEHFAKLFEQGGVGWQQYGKPVAVFVADEVAWPGRGREFRRAIFETQGHGEDTTAMMDTLAHLALLKNASSALPGDGVGDGTENFVVNYAGFGSDHISFLNQGIPAVLLIERDDDYHSNKWGHSSRDTFDHVDMSYGAAMTRLALRAVASFATQV